MKRILVVSDNDFILTSIEKLIGRSRGNFIHRVCTLDEDEIIEQIQRTDSNVVILDSSQYRLTASQLARLLNSTHELRVLLMQISSNEILIYDKQAYVLQRSEDLYSLI